MVIQGQPGQVLDLFKAVEQRLPVNVQGSGSLTGIVIALDERGECFQKI